MGEREEFAGHERMEEQIQKHYPAAQTQRKLSPFKRPLRRKQNLGETAGFLKKSKQPVLVL